MTICSAKNQLGEGASLVHATMRFRTLLHINSVRCLRSSAFPGVGPTLLSQALHDSTSCTGLCWGESRSQAGTALDPTYEIGGALRIQAVGADGVGPDATHRETPNKQANGGSPAVFAIDGAKLSTHRDTSRTQLCGEA